MSIDKFKNYYKEQKDKLNELLDKYNKELVKESNSIIKNNLEYFSNLNSNGKLIRGVLVNLGYNLFKDNKDYSNNLALAYEVFQTAILVHDDIIDKDEKRRDADTIHYANYKKYKAYSNELEVRHLGNSIGICMGDLGLYKANQLIAENYSNDPNLSKVLVYFNNTVLNTIRGELLDVILPFESKYVGVSNKLLEDSILNIYRLKTAHYTIIGPLTAGMILSGCSKKQEEDIALFGEKVGIAFQIQDDILGIYSDEIGKVVGSDIKEFKQTILYSHIVNTKYKDELLKVYGKDITKDSIIKVRELFKESGSYDYAVDMMNKLYDESLKELNNIDWIKEDKKEILKGFVEYLRNRKK